MVRVPIKEIDTKKVKMAKQVLAVFELLGISEEDLDNILSLKTLDDTLLEIKLKLNELTEKVEKLQRTAIAEESAKITKDINRAFKSGVEEYRLNGHKR